ncbi:hypothetical protein C7S16_4818 [Burkholderia thailandensis]|uniref:Uncharacterized protein n=1 Tax=Burkholderia thailandensis TaxID=57975 RepID=A0AAW9CMR4_BURTH|nr:hypothetical protein [Burkholderia thailandensis]MDW9250846.1 hypothetical protein [Burkholderia thailandensis]
MEYGKVCRVQCSDKFPQYFDSSTQARGHAGRRAAAAHAARASFAYLAAAGIDS